MSAITETTITQIAQDIEDWGDGWRFIENPDDHGRRARLLRDGNDDGSISIEFEIRSDGDQRFVFGGCRVKMSDGHWQEVSLSLRNPTNRKALDYINHQLDKLAS